MVLREVACMNFENGDSRGMPYNNWQVKYGHRLATEAEMREERQAVRSQQEQRVMFGEKKKERKR